MSDQTSWTPAEQPASGSAPFGPTPPETAAWAMPSGGGAPATHGGATDVAAYQPAAPSPYGPPSTTISPYAPPPEASPYGVPPGASPYGVPPGTSPYGVPPGTSPYGVPPSVSPDGSPVPYAPPAGTSRFGTLPSADPYGSPGTAPYGGAAGSSYAPSPYGAGPAYGVPTYAPPPYGQVPYAPYRQAGTDGFAVAALVFGILGGWLAFVFGIIALSRIRRSGARGRGLAIAGMAVAAGWIVLLVVMALAGGATTSWTGA